MHAVAAVLRIVAGSARAVGLAITAPLVAVLLWARFAAPRRAPLPRPGFEVLVFGVAVAALLDAGSAAPALALGAIVVLNTAMLVGSAGRAPARP